MALMIPDWEKEWVRGWGDDESSLHILCGQGAVTMLPPPTWNILSRPHTNSHTQWQKIPVPVPVPPVFICFHTYKTISGSSSPHVAPAEQLRCRITGVNSAESFPVCSSTEEKITHTIISSTFPKVFTMLPFLQGKAEQGGTPTEELLCEFGCLCVGAGFLLHKVTTENRQKGAFTISQGCDGTGSSHQCSQLYC